MRRNGFTLTELLVITGITLMAVALLLPALSRAYDNEEVAKCASNLRQIGQAEQKYMQDYDGTGFPRYIGIGQWGGVPFAEVAGYMPERPDDVYVCPSQHPYNDIGSDETQGVLMTYGQFELLPGGRAPYQDGNWTRVWDISQPSHYMRFGDSVALDDGHWAPAGSQIYQIHSTGGTGERRLHIRHEARANVVFADGSVETADVPRIIEAYGYMISRAGNTIIADKDLDTETHSVAVLRQQ